MKTRILTLIALTAASSVRLIAADPDPGDPEDNGLTPRTATIDANVDNNNTETESLGMALAANGNVLVGIEDDSTTDVDIFFIGAAWQLFDRTGAKLSTRTTIHSLNAATVPSTWDAYYRAFFRADGTPTPPNTGWGPKVKGNLFGDGMGMAASAYALGIEVAALGAINLDAGGGDDFPAAQLLNNDGTPIGIVSVSDGDAETAGGMRIGDWDYLSNGNILLVGENRQNIDLVNKFGGAVARRHVVYKIVSPSGAEVKALSLASQYTTNQTEMWHGAGVTRNGFALRWNGVGDGAVVRMFDNNGNPTTGNIRLRDLTGNPNAGGGGRGDGTGFHGNGRDAYVAVCADGGVTITVLNDNGTLRWSRKVTEPDETEPAPDRVDAAMAVDGRVLVVFDHDFDPLPPEPPPSTVQHVFRLPMARMFAHDGNPLGDIFWLSERDKLVADGGVATATGERVRVAWRDNTIACVWQSGNSPETFDTVAAFRIFDVETPPLITSIVDNGATVTIDWISGGPTYSVHSRPTITSALSVPPLATGLTVKTFTTPKTGAQTYYSVSSP